MLINPAEEDSVVFISRNLSALNAKQDYLLWFQRNRRRKCSQSADRLFPAGFKLRKEGLFICHLLCRNAQSSDGRGQRFKSMSGTILWQEKIFTGFVFLKTSSYVMKIEILTENLLH